MTDAVFAYGTLQIPDVMQAVTGRSFPQHEAILEGFARFLVRGQVYPGIIEQQSSTTDGVLYRGVDAESLARLDEFEGPLYARRRVRVLRRDGVTQEALTYVIPEARRHVLSTEPWDRQEFIAQHLSRWVARGCLSRRPGKDL